MSHVHHACYLLGISLLYLTCTTCADTKTSTPKPTRQTSEKKLVPAKSGKTLTHLPNPSSDINAMNSLAIEQLALLVNTGLEQHSTEKREPKSARNSPEKYQTDQRTEEQFQQSFVESRKALLIKQARRRSGTISEAPHSSRYNSPAKNSATSASSITTTLPTPLFTSGSADAKTAEEIPFSARSAPTESVLKLHTGSKISISLYVKVIKGLKKIGEKLYPENPNAILLLDQLAQSYCKREFEIRAALTELRSLKTRMGIYEQLESAIQQKESALQEKKFAHLTRAEMPDELAEQFSKYHFFESDEPNSALKEDVSAVLDAMYFGNIVARKQSPIDQSTPPEVLDQIMDALGIKTGQDKKEKKKKEKP